MTETGETSREEEMVPLPGELLRMAPPILD